MAYDPSLKRAFDAAGGPAALARALKLTPSAVTQWRKLPPRWLPAVSKLTKIPERELRPDLYRDAAIIHHAAQDAA